MLSKCPGSGVKFVFEHSVDKMAIESFVHEPKRINSGRISDFETIDLLRC